MERDFDEMTSAELESLPERHTLCIRDELESEFRLAVDVLGGVYCIDFSECATAEDALGWLLHLCDKEWMTKEHVSDFIVATKLL